MSTFTITIHRPGQRPQRITGLFPSASAADDFALDQIGEGAAGGFSVKKAGIQP